MKWIVESPTHLRQLPEMEFPNMGDSTALEYLVALNEWQIKLASMPTIPRGDNGVWSIGGVIDDKDFEIIKNVVSKGTCPYCGGHDIIMFSADDDMCNECGKWFPAVGEKAIVEKVAIPKQQPEKEENEDVLWEEAKIIVKENYTHWATIQKLKQQFSIKRR